MLLRMPAENMVKPRLDAVEQFGPLGEHAGVDEEVAQAVEDVALGVAVEEIMGDGLVVSTLGEACQQLNASAAAAEPGEY
ncbi:hypothetical protein [Streptosporangium sp. NPDC087985]|uniref:hypothetical protein n=1 Tax=Streptosporangium sp. NPDC087985 TaxID=3366196 RepID=UPI0038305F1B